MSALLMVGEYAIPPERIKVMMTNEQGGCGVLFDDEMQWFLNVPLSALIRAYSAAKDDKSTGYLVLYSVEQDGEGKWIVKDDKILKDD